MGLPGGDGYNPFGAPTGGFGGGADMPFDWAAMFNAPMNNMAQAPNAGGRRDRVQYRDPDLGGGWNSQVSDYGGQAGGRGLLDMNNSGYGGDAWRMPYDDMAMGNYDDIIGAENRTPWEDGQRNVMRLILGLLGGPAGMAGAMGSVAWNAMRNRGGEPTGGGGDVGMGGWKSAGDPLGPGMGAPYPPGGDFAQYYNQPRSGGYSGIEYDGSPAEGQPWGKPMPGQHGSADGRGDQQGRMRGGGGQGRGRKPRPGRNLQKPAVMTGGDPLGPNMGAPAPTPEGWDTVRGQPITAVPGPSGNRGVRQGRGPGPRLKKNRRGNRK